MTHAPTVSRRIACRIGPLVLAAEEVRLSSESAEAAASERGFVLDPPLEGFRVGSAAGPNQIEADVVLRVERRPLLKRPGGPVVYQHRAGWDLYRAGEEYAAIKAIPYGSDRILRRLSLDLEVGTAVLEIAPEDDRPDEPFAYTLSELLALLLTRVSHAVLVHAACVVVDGEAILFTGTSRSGKSTMATLWDRSVRGIVLGDESHLIWTGASGQVVVSGTPWPGSSGLYSNRTAPLRCIYFLEHGPRNLATSLTPADGMLTLMSHCFLPSWDPVGMEIVTDLCGRIAERHPLSRLAFVPDSSVVDFVLTNTDRQSEYGRTFSVHCARSVHPVRSVRPGTLSDSLTLQLAQDLLSSGRAVRLRARGWSMRPCLRDGDMVEISRVEARELRRGDVAAFAQPAGKPASVTIHRFVGRGRQGLLFQGDALPVGDAPVSESAVLGRVLARERGGRRVEIGAGWRRKAGPLILMAGPALRAAMRFYRGLLRLYRGGPSLPIPGGLDAVRDRVALAAALGHGMHPETACALFGGAPIESLLNDPSYHPLLPCLAWQHREGRLGDLDAPCVDLLRAQEESALFRSAQHEAMLRFLAPMLRQAGLELLIVKGAEMAFNGVYPAPHLRLGTDVDALCPPHTVRRAIRLLLGAGFANAEPEYPLSYYLTYRNEVALYRKGHRWPILEIHWGPAGPMYYLRRLPLERLWRSSIPGPWGPGLRVLPPEMELVHALVHLTKHMRHLRPIWALDFLFLARQSLNWRRVEREISRARLEWPAWFIFRWLEKRAPGTIPPSLLEGVARNRSHAPWNWIEMRVLHRMCDGHGRWLEAMYLPTWRQRLGYLREVAAPSRPVMERLYPGAKDRWILPFHLRRWGRLMSKLTRRSIPDE